MSHNTRLARQSQSIGEKGSLLGDYLEFGCWEGESFHHVVKVASPLMPWMRFWAFDSFQGLPKLQGVDKEGGFLDGQYACDQETFLKNISYPGIDLQRVVCVPGWYDQSLNSQVKQKGKLTIASIVYVDCDLYGSAMSVLNFLTDIVDTGSVILFDDWFCFKGDPGYGVQRACAEWLHGNPQLTLTDWHLFGSFGKSFLVKKKC